VAAETIVGQHGPDLGLKKLEPIRWRRQKVSAQRRT
jgi:hypothetical protein